MAGLKAHLKKIEVRQRELAELRENKRQFLFVTWMPESPFSEQLPDPAAGEHQVRDYFIDSDPLWRPNYCVLRGTRLRRNTADPCDHGVVYDARSLHSVDNWSEGPPAGLPVLSVLRSGGKIDPDEVQHWPGAIVKKRRIPMGTARKRAGSR